MKLARRKAKREVVYLKSSGIPCLFYILKIPTCHKADILTFSYMKWAQNMCKLLVVRKVSDVMVYL